MTRDAQNRRFTYDAENKQIKVETVDGNGDPVATIGEYVYDGDGKRIKKIVTNGESVIFVYDAAGKLIAEYANQTSQTPQISYLTNDHLGSPRINTDGAGNIIARHDYHPFGEEIIGTGGRTQGLDYTTDEIRKQFTGYERDGETSLDFAQARYYAKNHGRFQSVDPLLSTGHPDDPQSWHRFSYVLNNPLQFVDPTGECIAPTLQKGQVGICLEAFIATKTVGTGGLGRGDGRSFNGNNEYLSARVMVTAVVSTIDNGNGGVQVKWNTAVWPSEIRAEVTLTDNGRIDLPDGSRYSSTMEVGTSFQGSAEGSGAVISNNNRTGEDEDFGSGVDITVSIANGKNGAQLSSNPIIRAAAPAGTIDGSITLQISGAGNVKGLSAEGRPFPSYAAYSYTLGSDGKTIITKEHLKQVEIPPVSNLTKPVEPFKIIQ